MMAYVCAAIRRQKTGHGRPAAILAAMTHARGDFGGKRVWRRPVRIKPAEQNKYRDRKR